VAISEGQFKAVEKRFAAFKHVFNILNTTVGRDPSGEGFETAHQIFVSELITEEVQLANSAAETYPIRTQTFTGSFTDEASIWSGSFSSSHEDLSTANPYVEKFVIPLVKKELANGQTYVAYTRTDGNTYKDLKPNPPQREIGNLIMFKSGSQRNKNWINPTRYGSGYSVKIYSSLADYSGPDTAGGEIDIGGFNSDPSGFAHYGGWIFDYYQGTVFIGVKANEDYPDMSTHRHPLWAIGYRYIGPTGSAATSNTASYVETAQTASFVSSSIIWQSGSEQQGVPTQSLILKIGDNAVYHTGSLTNRVLTIDTASGQIFYTGSADGLGGGQGSGFPFSGNGVITGSLFISGSAIHDKALSVSGAISSSTLHAISASFVSASFGHYIATTYVNQQVIQTHHSQSIFSGSTIFGAPSGGHNPLEYVHQFTGSIDVSGSGEMRIPSISFDYASGSYLKFDTFSASEGFVGNISYGSQSAYSFITSSIVTGSLIISGNNPAQPTLDVRGDAVFRSASSAEPYFSVRSSGSGNLEIAGYLSASEIRLTNPLVFGEFTDLVGSATSTASFQHIKAGDITASGYLIVDGVLTESAGTNSDRTVSAHFKHDISASGYIGEYFDITDQVIITSTSTQWGSSSDDLHQFTGSVDMSGSITAYNLSGTNTGDQDLTNLLIKSETGSFVKTSGTASLARITASGHISTSQNLIGEELILNGGTFTSASLASVGGVGFPYTGDANIFGTLTVTSASTFDNLLISQSFGTSQVNRDLILKKTGPLTGNKTSSIFIQANDGTNLFELLDYDTLTGRGGFQFQPGQNQCTIASTKPTSDSLIFNTSQYTGSGTSMQFNFANQMSFAEGTIVMGMKDGGIYGANATTGLKILRGGVGYNQIADIGGGGSGHGQMRIFDSSGNIDITFQAGTNPYIRSEGSLEAETFVSGSELRLRGGTFTSASLAAASAGGDNLGNHTAEEMLNMDNNAIVSASLIKFYDGTIQTTAGGGGGGSSIWTDLGGGNKKYSGSLTLTGSLTVSGSSTLTNIGTLVAEGNISSSDTIGATKYQVDTQTVLDAYELSGTPTLDIGSTTYQSIIKSSDEVVVTHNLKFSDNNPRTIKLAGSNGNVDGATLTIQGAHGNTEVNGNQDGGDIQLNPGRGTGNGATGSVKVEGDISSSGAIYAGKYITLKPKPIGSPTSGRVNITGSLSVSGSNTFKVEGPTELTGSFSVNSGSTDVVIDDTGLIVSGGKMEVTGSVYATGNAEFIGSMTAMTSSVLFSEASKFIPKNTTADIGDSLKRISTIYMASSIDWNTGTNNTLQLIGGHTGRMRFYGNKALFTEAGALGGAIENLDTTSPFMSVMPLRIDPRVPILRVGQSDRPIFDVTIDGAVDHTGGDGGGGHLDPIVYGSAPRDKFNQAPVQANIKMYDYTIGSPISGGAWIDFQTVSTGSDGITSGSAGIIGMWSGKPTFGLGTNSPSASLHISSSISGSYSDLVRIQNDIGVPIFKVKPDRLILRNSGSSAYEATMSVDSGNNLVINDNLKINHTDIRLKSPDGTKEVKMEVSNNGDLTFTDSNDAKIMDMKEGGKIDVGGTAATSQSITNWEGAISASGFVKCKNTFLGTNYGWPNAFVLAHSDRISHESMSLNAAYGFAFSQAASGITYLNAGDGQPLGYKSIEFLQAGVISARACNNRNWYIGTNQHQVTYAAPEKLTVDGNISASGDLKITGGVTASGDINGSGHYYVGLGKNVHFAEGDTTGREYKIQTNNSGLTFTSGSTTHMLLKNGGGTSFVGDIDVSGKLSVTNDLTAARHISASKTLYGSKLDIASDASISGDISASGDITGSGLYTSEDSYFGGDLWTEQGNYLRDKEGAGKLGWPLSHTFMIYSQSIVRFSITKDGIGIGNGSPPEALTVEGNISASGTISGSAGTFNRVNIDGKYFDESPTYSTKLYSSTGFHSEDDLVVNSHITASGNISGSSTSTLTIGGNASIGGTLTATRKSFLIPHPTKEDKQLQYASLEGPENGVYVRGKLKGDDIIELPEYWSELIDEDTITVSLTPIGRFQYLYVKDINSKEIMVGIDKGVKRKIYCHYVVYAERKDIDKLEVEL